MNAPTQPSPLISWTTRALLALTALTGLWVLWSHSTVWDQTLTRGPYLQQGTPTSMVVVWRTHPASDAIVWYGPSPQQLTSSVRSNQKKTQHELRITGLQPATRYYYAIGTTTQRLAGGSSEQYFWTSPTVGSTPKIRLWVVGDSGTGGSRQSAVRDAMLTHTGKHKPNLFLHMGDMAYSSGLDLEFQFKFFDVYKGILRNTVCWPTMGNHEGRSARSGPQTGPYYDAYVLPTKAEAGGVASGTEAYYSFDYGNVHMIVLDSHDSPRTPSGAMLQWLKRDLASTQQTWIIAYWHHPPYSKGSHNSDTEGRLIDMRKYALPILEAAGVDLVLTGHSHIYERSYLLHGAYGTPTTDTSKIRDKGDGKLTGDGPYQKPTPSTPGAVYVVVGHGGAGVRQRGVHPLMYFTEKANGSCLIDIHGHTLTLRNLRHDGKITDRFTLVKGTGLALATPSGGERYTYGETVAVRWHTTGTIPQVRLSLSLDNGQTWTPLTGAIPNQGRYTWTVPHQPSQQALLRVADAAKPSRSDQSDTPFAIAATPPREEPRRKEPSPDARQPDPMR